MLNPIVVFSLLACWPLCYCLALFNQQIEGAVQDVVKIRKTEPSIVRSKRTAQVKLPYEIVHVNQLVWDIAGYAPNIRMRGNISLEWYVRENDTLRRVAYAYRGNKYVMGYPLYGRTDHGKWFKVEHPTLQFTLYFSSYPRYRGEDDLQLSPEEANADFSGRSYSNAYINRYENRYNGWAGSNENRLGKIPESDFDESNIPYSVANGSDLCFNIIGEKYNRSQVWYIRDKTNQLRLITHAYWGNKYTEKGPVYACTDSLQWYRIENAPHNFKVYLFDLGDYNGEDDLLLSRKEEETTYKTDLNFHPWVLRELRHELNATDNEDKTLKERFDTRNTFQTIKYDDY